MRYWILKANTTGAHAYNYARRLKPGDTGNWERVPASGKLSVGDRVFLWASASKPHLAGLGEVIKPTGKFLRVRYLTFKFEQGPDITFLKTRKEFAGAYFLKPIPGTAFELSATEAQALYCITTMLNTGIQPWKDWPTGHEFEDAEAEAMAENSKLIPHLRRERNPLLAKKKKADFRRKNKGRLYCEACTSPHAEYKNLTSDIFEVHHRLPLSKAKGPVKTKLSDLAVLCPNCHRAINRTKPMLPVEKLAKQIKSLP
jgi:predicted HNH restriction endonuclease